MKSITIADIAKEAGVSKATVSRVINRSAPVESSTFKKVEAVIKKKGFSPSAIARDLSYGVSSTVGIVIPEIGNAYFGNLLCGAFEVANQNQLMLMCFNTDNSVEMDYKALDALSDYRVRGMLYTPAGYYDTEEQKKTVTRLLEKLNVPVVIMDRGQEIFNKYDSVFFPDRKSMFEATEKLILAGHRKIGLLNGVETWGISRIREAGYRDALEKYGIPYEEKYCYYTKYTVESSYKRANGILDSGDCPTAILACSNRISVGLLKALAEHGMKIPDDIAVIGLDRIEALDVAGNGFNYIRRDPLEMGRKAMEMLIHRFNFPSEAPKNICLDSEIVIHKL